MIEFKPRIGLLSFSDGRKRVHEGLKAGIEAHQANIRAALEEIGAEVVLAGEVIYTPRMAVTQAKKLLGRDVAAVIFNIPVFAFPNLSVLAANVLQKPVAIASPGESHLPGMGGMLAAGGAIEQIGLQQQRIWGPLSEDKVQRQLEMFVRAAHAKHTLRGQVYGQFGGRSIGMQTGVACSGLEWARVFGVDIDHVDQGEILRQAEDIGEAERTRMIEWMQQHFGRVAYEENSKLTPETLKFQAACAQAVKKISAQREFDFIGIKCHYDMSEYYCTQCLSAALLPTPLDWDGERQPMVCACEADGDGALTMQILQLITARPALFMDLRHYDRNRDTWTLCNCGGQSLYYSRRSDNPEENLAAAELVPVISKYGGVGAHVRYAGCEGPLTFARIMRDADGIALLATTGRALPAELLDLEQSCPAWPHLFVSLDADPKALLDTLHANHLHAVEGYWMDAMEKFAELAGIRFVVPKGPGR